MRKSSKPPKRCERLKDLRKQRGYTQEHIAQQLDVNTKTYRSWEIGEYKNGIQKYPTIDCDKLKSLSHLYNVSIDYLLGISDCTSVENEEIHKQIGLSDNAIQTLKILNKTQYSTLLNYLMDDYITFAYFLSNIELYFDNTFDTPVHYDETIQAYVESKDIGDSPIINRYNNERYVAIGRKTDYEVGNKPAYETIHVPTSILESHAMHKIQEQFDIWKNGYKKEVI